MFKMCYVFTDLQKEVEQGNFVRRTFLDRQIQYAGRVWHGSIQDCRVGHVPG